MRKTVRAVLAPMLLAIAAVGSAGPARAESFSATSTEGHYAISLESSGALAINTIESWIVTVTDAGGQPIDNAEIVVTGGMPAHGHGLPTAPAISAALGDGRYQLDGVKFNMTGTWLLELAITAAHGSDTATIAVDLQP